MGFTMQGLQTTFLGMRELPRDISDFEMKAFWGRNRAEEKKAVEAFMNFVTAWLRQHSSAHIYHYAHYEQTALKKLMSLHGTREAEVDCPGQVFSDTLIGCVIADFCSKALGGKLPSVECSRTLL